MTERNPRRAAQLIETARLELANYANGGIDQLTPPTELGKIFRYSDSYTKTIFGRSGLNTERILAQEAREQLPFPESSELAWMIGYLSSSSTARVTSNNSSYINIAESVPEREHKLVELSEKLFNVTPHHYKRLKWGKEYGGIRISNAHLQRRLGALDRSKAPETIRSRYPWILDDPEFGWKFIEGLFEAKGSVGGNTVLFTGDNQIYAAFTIELLKSLGIEDAHIQFTDRQKQKMNGVAVRSAPSLQKIASKITSVHPKSQEKFDVIKLREYRQWPQPTVVEILSLWKKAYASVGGAPSMNQLRHFLKEDDSTNISHSTVIRILGDGDHAKAREFLEKFAKNYEPTESPNNSSSDDDNQLIDGQSCIHRWIIESPNGTSFVSGRCKRCGAMRDFRSSHQELDWNTKAEREKDMRLMQRGIEEAIT